MGRPRGSTAFSATSTGVPSSMTFWISPMKRVRMRFTTNAGASLTSTAVFFSFLATAKAVASEASSVRSPRTISRRGRTATGLKKWKPTTRSGCLSFDAISVTDRDEVFVARIAWAGATASTSANTCCLTSILSKTASMTKSASENPSALSRTPVTRALRRLALSWLMRPLPSSLSISAWT